MLAAGMTIVGRKPREMHQLLKELREGALTAPVEEKEEKEDVTEGKAEVFDEEKQEKNQESHPVVTKDELRGKAIAAAKVIHKDEFIKRLQENFKAQSLKDLDQAQWPAVAAMCDEIIKGG